MKESDRGVRQVQQPLGPGQETREKAAVREHLATHTLHGWARTAARLPFLCGPTAEWITSPRLNNQGVSAQKQVTTEIKTTQHCYEAPPERG